VLLRGSGAIAIVYSMTDRVSFEEVKTLWLPAARGQTECPIVIVASKCDDLENRVISSAEGRLLALENKCSYVETSPKTGYGVQRVFLHLASVGCKRSIEDLAVPKSKAEQPPSPGVLDSVLNFFKSL
jgi:GTPase SAR1 family protein